MSHSIAGGIQSSASVGTAPFSSDASTQSSQPSFKYYKAWYPFGTHPFGEYWVQFAGSSPQ